MALVLHLMAQTGKSVSELLDDIPRYSMIKEKLTCPANKIPAITRMIRREYSDYPTDTRDGVKVELPNGWLLVRGSNTEPIIRVVAEAKSEDEARAIVRKVSERVEAAMKSAG
jgi:phosphomannomutase